VGGAKEVNIANIKEEDKFSDKKLTFFVFTFDTPLTRFVFFLSKYNFMIFFYIPFSVDKYIEIYKNI